MYYQEGHYASPGVGCLIGPMEQCVLGCLPIGPACWGSVILCLHHNCGPGQNDLNTIEWALICMGQEGFQPYGMHDNCAS